MMETNAALVIIALGVAGIVALTAIAVLRAQATQRTANKLVELALGGRADEARILARNATSDVSSLLDALAGELSRPKRVSHIKDVLLLGPIVLPLLILGVHGAAQIRPNLENHPT